MRFVQLLHCYIVQSLRGGGGWRWRSEESAKLGEGGRAVEAAWWRQCTDGLHPAHTLDTGHCGVMAAVLCYPYGVTITCVCDNSGSVYNCYPTNYKNKHNSHLTTNSAVQVSSVV